MATRTNLAVVPEAVPVETSTRIEYLQGIAEVTVSRSYRLNMLGYEHGDNFACIKVTVSSDTDMAQLGQQLQDELDDLQSPELNRLADILDKHNPKRNPSFLDGLLS